MKVEVQLEFLLKRLSLLLVLEMMSCLLGTLIMVLQLFYLVLHDIRQIRLSFYYYPVY